MKHQLRHIFILLAAMTAAFNVQAATTAESVVASLRARIASAKAIEIIFTVKGQDGPVQGSAVISGLCFTMTTPELSVWYDGATQWTLLPASKEVNITAPTAVEINAVNPFAILTDCVEHYTVRRLKDRDGCKVVSLTPWAKGDGVDNYEVSVDGNGQPTVIVINFEDGRRIHVSIDSFLETGAKAPAVFVFDKSKYPGCEVVDLR